MPTLLEELLSRFRKPVKVSGIRYCQDCYYFSEMQGYYGYCRRHQNPLVSNMAPLCPYWSPSPSGAGEPAGKIITQIGVLLGEDNTSFQENRGSYHVVKQVLILLYNKKTVTDVAYEVMKSSESLGGTIKITYQVDEGTETLIVEQEITDTEWTWYSKQCTVPTGAEVLLRVYLLRYEDGGFVYNKGFKAFGTIETESLQHA